MTHLAIPSFDYSRVNEQGASMDPNVERPWTEGEKVSARLTAPNPSHRDLALALVIELHIRGDMVVTTDAPTC
jgi:hypothetical protein